MKHLMVALMLCWLGACVGPNGVPDRAPHPVPAAASSEKAALMRKPPECAACNAQMRTRLATCGSQSGSCMATCSGSDAMKTALCQSNCQQQYAACAQYASMPNDCPAYCAL